MVVTGVRFQERICLSPCSTTVKLFSENRRNRDDALSIMRESIKFGIRPYLACAIVEAEPFCQPIDLEGADCISTVTLQGQSSASYNIFNQQCINSWSIPQDLVFTCPASFLPSSEQKSTLLENKDDGDVSVDLFSNQSGTLYAVIASGLEIPSELMHRQVRLWKISAEDELQGPILNQETQITKKFEKPICRLTPVRKYSNCEVHSAFVVIVYSDAEVVVMSQDLDEVLASSSKESMGDNRLLWSDTNTHQIQHKNKIVSVPCISIIYQTSNGSKLFSNYFVQPQDNNIITLIRDRVVYLPEFHMSTNPLIAIFQKDSDTLIIKSPDRENLLVCNFDSENKQYSNAELVRKIDLSEYDTHQCDKYPFSRVDLCDVGDGYFLVSGVTANREDILTVYDSRYCVKHYQKIIPSKQDSLCNSSIYFHSQNAGSCGNRFIILSRVNFTDHPDKISYSISVDLIPYSCLPLSTLTLLGKALPYMEHQDQCGESQVKLIHTNSISEFNCVPNFKQLTFYPYIPIYFLNSNTTSEFKKYNKIINSLLELEESYVSMLCDKNKISSELQFDLQLCEFVQAHERLTLEHKNSLFSGNKKKIKLPEYLNAKPSRLLLSNLKVINISQKFLLFLLVRSFSNPLSFWPRISMFYLLRCSNEISSVMFPFSIIARCLSRGDLSMVEMVLDRIPDVREYELIELIRWASGADHGIWNLNGDNFLMNIQSPPVCRKKTMRTWIKERLLEETGQNARPGYRSKEYLNKKTRIYNSKKRSGNQIPVTHVSCSMSYMKHLIYKMVFYNGNYCREFITQSLRSLLKINELLDLTSWCIREITGVFAQNINLSTNQSLNMMNIILDGVIKESESKKQVFKKHTLRGPASAENCLKALKVLTLILDSHFSIFVHTPELRIYVRELHRIIHRDVKIIGYLSKMLVGPINNILEIASRAEAEKLNKNINGGVHYRYNKRLRRMIDDCSGPNYQVEQYTL